MNVWWFVVVSLAFEFLSEDKKTALSQVHASVTSANVMHYFVKHGLPSDWRSSTATAYDTMMQITFAYMVMDLVLHRPLSHPSMYLHHAVVMGAILYSIAYRIYQGMFCFMLVNEVSTLFLNMYVQTVGKERRDVALRVFATAFFLFRVVPIGYLLCTLVHPLPFVAACLLFTHVVLNLFWFCMIVRKITGDIVLGLISVLVFAVAVVGMRKSSLVEG